MTTFHIYCDESCHLEHDGHTAMVLGAVRCPAESRRQISVDLRELKKKHGLSPTFELKWTKSSPGKLAYYQAVLDYFAATEDLTFRAVVVPDKSALRHADFGQTHDEFYYKLYFILIRHLLEPEHCFRIFLDIKDTRSWAKTLKLHEVLANSRYDFDRRIVQSIDIVRSEHVELIQLTDLLTGCVSYANRGLSSSPAKAALVERLRQRTGLQLTRTTLVRARKVNVFRWEGQPP